MTDQRLNSNGNVSLWFVASNGFANWQAPTATEINAGTFLGDAVSWNDYGFGVQTSDTTNDPPLNAKAKVLVRGANKYGGDLSFYYPGVFGDTSNKYNSVFNLFQTPGLVGYLVVRIDGDTLGTTTGTANNPGTLAAANDLVHVFKVQTDAMKDTIVGDGVKFRYTYTFVSQGQSTLYSVVTSGTAPTVAITPLTFTGTAAGKTKIALTATVNGRKMTRGVKWASSDPTKATVSANGIVTAVAAGTVNITATYPETGTLSAAPSVGTIS